MKPDDQHASRIRLNEFPSRTVLRSSSERTKNHADNTERTAQGFLPERTLNFEDRVAAHLRKIFPERSELLGQEKLAELIQRGINRARVYEIVAQRDVCKYLDLIMIFGQDFDIDPKLAWASATLHEEFLQGHPTEKILRLCDVAMEHSQDAEQKTEATNHV